MALHFNYENTADPSLYAASDDTGRNELLNSLAFATMFVGINKITDDNYHEFYRRYIAVNMAVGGNDWHLKLSDVRQAVGFSTNASNLTITQFRKQLAERIEERARTALKVENNG